MMKISTDVLVIGGGHAGMEAVLAAKRCGVDSKLLTFSSKDIGVLSCNPSIGGPGKGNLVAEIEALGGAMGILTDEASVQSRTLNESRGPAVQSPRMQLDRLKYHQLSLEYLIERNIEIIEEEAISIERNKENFIVNTSGNTKFYAKAVVLCNGTFLKGTLHYGDKVTEGGRAGDAASNSLSESLKNLGFELFRLKTGTPPRIHVNSVNHDVMERQDESANPPRFSEFSNAFRLQRMPCYITRTTEDTHKIVLENIHKSAAFSGAIEGSGPRFCPSFETKVETFPDRKIHRVFVEPEGLTSEEYYLQGLSTALPYDVQLKMIRSVTGLEDAQITRYGYAVEYDCIDPRMLDHSLNFIPQRGLFLAGQINGTSGYEEAAAQGLIAGINAASFVKGEKPFIMGRHEGYTGILIDDLVKKGCDEPYRMFTSRSEFRIIQRCQNAWIRLFERAVKYNLISEGRIKLSQERIKKIDDLEKLMKSRHINEKNTEIIRANIENDQEGEKYLSNLGSLTGVSLYSFAGRPYFNWRYLDNIEGLIEEDDIAVLEEVQMRARYGGYAAKLLRQAEALKAASSKNIPDDIDYYQIPGLSRESKERWTDHKPSDMYSAAAIPGITPADLGLLLRWIKRGLR